MADSFQPSEFPPEYWLDPSFDLTSAERADAARLTTDSLAWSERMLTLVDRALTQIGILASERDMLIDAFRLHLTDSEMIQLAALIAPCPIIPEPFGTSGWDAAT